MSRLIKIEGVIEIKDDEDINYCTDQFINFIESKGWYFGGGTREITDEENPE